MNRPHTNRTIAALLGAAMLLNVGSSVHAAPLGPVSGLDFQAPTPPGSSPPRPLCPGTENSNQCLPDLNMGVYPIDWLVTYSVKNEGASTANDVVVVWKYVCKNNQDVVKEFTGSKNLGSVAPGQSVWVTNGGCKYVGRIDEYTWVQAIATVYSSTKDKDLSNNSSALP